MTPTTSEPREIKFRAWDKDAKVMTKPRDLFWLMFSPNNSYSSEASLVWMQYTGLLDKNGVEIYEDDIVESAVSTRWTEPFRFTVDWVPNMCRFGLRQIRGELTTKVGGFDHSLEVSDIYSKGNTEYLEVIGNIYSNPELLP